MVVSFGNEIVRVKFCLDSQTSIAETPKQEAWDMVPACTHHVLHGSCRMNGACPDVLCGCLIREF